MGEKILVRLLKIEQRYKRLKTLLSAIAALFIISALGLAFSKTEKFNILAKGIIIEDTEGKDRILIGSPIPFSNTRVRTDTSLVRKYWANKIFPGNPDKYMEYYKKYNHSTEGIVIMNGQGFDRVLLGDRLADANT